MDGHLDGQWGGPLDTSHLVEMDGRLDGQWGGQLDTSHNSFLDGLMELLDHEEGISPPNPDGDEVAFQGLLDGLEVEILPFQKAGPTPAEKMDKYGLIDLVGPEMQAIMSAGRPDLEPEEAEPWPVPESLQVPWPVPESLQVPWPVPESLQVPWPVPESLQVPWPVPESLQVPWPVPESLQVPWPEPVSEPVPEPLAVPEVNANKGKPPKKRKITWVQIIPDVVQVEGGDQMLGTKRSRQKKVHVPGEPVMKKEKPPRSYKYADRPKKVVDSSEEVIFVKEVKAGGSKKGEGVPKVRKPRGKPKPQPPPRVKCEFERKMEEIMAYDIEKDIIEPDEELNPEELVGFEHVEIYQCPPLEDYRREYEAREAFHQANPLIMSYDWRYKGTYNCC